MSFLFLARFADFGRARWNGSRVGRVSGIPRGGSEKREQYNLANCVGVREQHYQPVNSNSLAGSRRQAVAQRANVIHIDFLGRFLPALCDLREKTLLLVEWVVKLREAVRDLHTGNEQLEALGQ